MRQYLISLVSVLIFVFTFTGDAKAVWLIEFDYKDCRVKTIDHWIDDKYEKTEYYKYNDHNNRQMVEVKDSEGNIIEVRIFRYDDNERLLSIEELDNHEKDNGNITRVRYLRYDEDSGDLESIEHWDDLEESGGNLIQTEELYKKNGDLDYKIFRNEANDEIDIDKVEYYYFDEGTLIKIETFDNVKTFDNYNGDPIKEENFIYNNDGTIQYVTKSGHGQELYEWECIDIDTGSGGGSGSSGSSGSSTSGCFIGTTF